MGCGSSSSAKKSEDEVEVNNVPEVQWATKTEAAGRGVGPSEDFGSAPKEMQPVPKKRPEDVKIDSRGFEEADDEAEMIDLGVTEQRPQARSGYDQYATTAVRQEETHTAASPGGQARAGRGGAGAQGGDRYDRDQGQSQGQGADDQMSLMMMMMGNPQDTPQMIEEAVPGAVQQPTAVTVVPTVTRPLPKQQVEEAAKMSDARKKFDNQRFNNSNPRGNTDNVTSGLFGTGDSAGSRAGSGAGGYGGASSVAPAQRNPASAGWGLGGPTEPVVPLSLTVDAVANERAFGAAVPDGGACCLPGGILDDLEIDDMDDPFAAPAARPEKKAKEEVKSNAKHFDDDDEALMKGILEEFEDF